MQGQPRFKLLILWADRLLMTDKCLSSLILFGENSLPRAVSNYLDHFHHERNHQGKGNLLLFPGGAAASPSPTQPSTIRCRERLGGLLKYYHSHAA